MCLASGSSVRKLSDRPSHPKSPNGRLPHCTARRNLFRCRNRIGEDDLRQAILVFAIGSWGAEQHPSRSRSFVAQAFLPARSSPPTVIPPAATVISFIQQLDESLLPFILEDNLVSDLFIPHGRRQFVPRFAFRVFIAESEHRPLVLCVFVLQVQPFRF